MRTHLKLTILRAITIAVFLLVPLPGRAASQEHAGRDRWWHAKFHAAAADLPFSFTLDGKRSAELLKAWKLQRTERKLDDNRERALPHLH